MSKGKKVELTDKQLKWLIAHYKHTKNGDIAEHLHISEATVHRFARRLQLKKSAQHLKKVQAASLNAAHLSHLRNGTYPPKGYIIPRREEFQFKRGESLLQRLGAKKNAERVRKATESRMKTFKGERARATFGLPQRTKLHVIPQPRKKVALRSYLKSRGYIVDDVARIVYYTDTTRRGRAIENKPQPWYKFKPINDQPKTE